MSFDYVALFWGNSLIGTAGTTQAVPAHLQTADSGIKIWTGASWDTLVNGTNNNTLAAVSTSNWGAEAEWAYQWRQANPTIPINIFHYWAGSLKTSDFIPNATYYNNMKGYLASALAALANPVVVADVSWIGDNDAYVLNDANAVQTNLESHVAGSKADFRCTDATKFLTVQVSSTYTQTYISTVRSKQAAFAAADSAARALVDSSGYAYQADFAHPAANGNVSAGQDLWTAYVGLTKRWGARWGS